MRSTHSIVATTLALILAPGCAVIDGLGGEDERKVDSNDTAPDAGGDTLGPSDAGGEADPIDSARTYRVVVTPPIEHSCAAFGPIVETFLPLPPGQTTADLMTPPPPEAPQGVVHLVADETMFFADLICLADNSRMATLRGPGDPFRYEGTWESPIGAGTFTATLE